MKKLKLSIFLVVAIISVVLYSCSKDDFSESDAMKLQAQLDKQRAQDQDTIAANANRVSYTVNLVDASTSSLKSSSLVSVISGATVKFVQGDSIITKTADASGIVVIGNVKPGLANVNISLTDFSEVNYTVNLSVSSTNGGREVTNIIPMIPIAGTSTGTIQGHITCESDLTNKTVEAVPAGTKVMAVVQTSSSALPTITSSGIISISYDKLSLSAVTNASGDFTMTVPATLAGLKYDFVVSDFTVNQKLLQDKYFGVDTTGVLTIPTNFGSSFTTASALTAGNPVTVVVSAPDYNYTQATATAIIDNPMSIDYIQNTNIGNYYYPSSTFNYTLKNTNTGGGDAVIKLVTDANGHATYNTIVSTPGSKFASSVNGKIDSISYIVTPAKAIVNSVNGSGAILTYSVVGTKTGEFFSKDNLQFVKLTGAGTGVISQLPSLAFGVNSISFNTTMVTLTTPSGSGFAVNDSIVLAIDPNKNNKYKYKAFLSTGSVTGINITNEGANYIKDSLLVVISSPLVGTTAKATATVKDGKISTISVTPGGSGYSTPPTVTILNKVTKVQAKFKAKISSEGKVIEYTPASSGSGYLTVPTVTITSAIPGASGATAIATVSATGSVSLTPDNIGSGYTGNYPSTAANLSSPGTITVKGNGSSVVNINLGTGKRTIEQ